MKLTDLLFGVIVTLLIAATILTALTSIDIVLGQLLSFVFPVSVFDAALLVGIMALVVCWIIYFLGVSSREGTGERYWRQYVDSEPEEIIKPTKAKKRKTIYRVD